MKKPTLYLSFTDAGTTAVPLFQTLQRCSAQLSFRSNHRWSLRCYPEKSCPAAPSRVYGRGKVSSRKKRKPTQSYNLFSKSWKWSFPSIHVTPSMEEEQVQSHCIVKSKTPISLNMQMWRHFTHGSTSIWSTPSGSLSSIRILGIKIFTTILVLPKWTSWLPSFCSTLSSPTELVASWSSLSVLLVWKWNKKNRG